MRILPHKRDETKNLRTKGKSPNGTHRRIEVTVEREILTVIQRRNPNQTYPESPEQRDQAISRLKSLLPPAGDLPPG